MPFGSTTLLGNAIIQAKASAAEEVITVLGANYDRITPEISFFNTTIVHNVNWDTGLGSSIAAGMKFVIKKRNFDAVILMLADQPFMNATYLNRIIEEHRKNPSKIVATQYPGSNGVPALFPKSCFSLILNLQGERGAKHVLNRNDSLVVVLDAGDKVFDIDTPEDYRQIKKKFYQ